MGRKATLLKKKIVSEQLSIEYSFAHLLGEHVDKLKTFLKNKDRSTEEAGDSIETYDDRNSNERDMYYRVLKNSLVRLDQAIKDLKNLYNEVTAYRNINEPGIYNTSEWMKKCNIITEEAYKIDCSVNALKKYYAPGIGDALVASKKLNEKIREYNHVFDYISNDEYYDRVIDLYKNSPDEEIRCSEKMITRIEAEYGIKLEKWTTISEAVDAIKQHNVQKKKNIISSLSTDDNLSKLRRNIIDVADTIDIPTDKRYFPYFDNTNYEYADGIKNILISEPEHISRKALKLIEGYDLVKKYKKAEDIKDIKNYQNYLEELKLSKDYSGGEYRNFFEKKDVILADFDKFFSKDFSEHEKIKKSDIIDWSKFSKLFYDTILNLGDYRYFKNTKKINYKKINIAGDEFDENKEDAVEASGIYDLFYEYAAELDKICEEKKDYIEKMNNKIPTEKLKFGIDAINNRYRMISFKYRDKFKEQVEGIVHKQLDEIYNYFFTETAKMQTAAADENIMNDIIRKCNNIKEGTKEYSKLIDEKLKELAEHKTDEDEILKQILSFDPDMDRYVSGALKDYEQVNEADEKVFSDLHSRPYLLKSNSSVILNKVNNKYFEAYSLFAGEVSKEINTIAEQIKGLDKVGYKNENIAVLSRDLVEFTNILSEHMNIYKKQGFLKSNENSYNKLQESVEKIKADISNLDREHRHKIGDNLIDFDEQIKAILETVPSVETILDSTLKEFKCDLLERKARVSFEKTKKSALSKIDVKSEAPLNEVFDLYKLDEISKNFGQIDVNAVEAYKNCLREDNEINRQFIDQKNIIRAELVKNNIDITEEFEKAGIDTFDNAYKETCTNYSAKISKLIDENEKNKAEIAKLEENLKLIADKEKIKITVTDEYRKDKDSITFTFNPKFWENVGEFEKLLGKSFNTKPLQVLPERAKFYSSMKKEQVSGLKREISNLRAILNEFADEKSKEDSTLKKIAQNYKDEQDLQKFAEGFRDEYFKYAIQKYETIAQKYLNDKNFKRRIKDKNFGDNIMGYTLKVSTLSEYLSNKVKTVKGKKNDEKLKNDCEQVNKMQEIMGNFLWPFNFAVEEISKCDDEFGTEYLDAFRVFEKSCEDVVKEAKKEINDKISNLRAIVVKNTENINSMKKSASNVEKRVSEVSQLGIKYKDNLKRLEVLKNKNSQLAWNTSYLSQCEKLGIRPDNIKELLADKKKQEENVVVELAGKTPKLKAHINGSIEDVNNKLVSSVRILNGVVHENSVTIINAVNAFKNVSKWYWKNDEVYNTLVDSMQTFVTGLADYVKNEKSGSVILTDKIMPQFKDLREQTGRYLRATVNNSAKRKCVKRMLDSSLSDDDRMQALEELKRLKWSDAGRYRSENALKFLIHLDNIEKEYKKEIEAKKFDNSTVLTSARVLQEEEDKLNINANSLHYVEKTKVNVNDESISDESTIDVTKINLKLS